MVFAWLLLAAAALVVIAHMLGWLPNGAPGLPAFMSRAANAPAPPASPTAPAARTQSGVVLLPGETLVEAPDANASPKAAAPAVAPAQPTYARPAPKPAAPHNAQAAPKPLRQPRASGFGPLPPAQYSQPEVRERESRSVCLNCATITSIQPRGEAWEVGVRFDDGTREVIRYYDPPRLRVGDAVHLEDGGLVRD